MVSNQPDAARKRVSARFPQLDTESDWFVGNQAVREVERLESFYNDNQSRVDEYVRFLVGSDTQNRVLSHSRLKLAVGIALGSMRTPTNQLEGAVTDHFGAVTNPTEANILAFLQDGRIEAGSEAISAFHDMDKDASSDGRQEQGSTLHATAGLLANGQPIDAASRLAQSDGIGGIKALYAIQLTGEPVPCMDKNVLRSSRHIWWPNLKDGVGPKGRPYYVSADELDYKLPAIRSTATRNAGKWYDFDSPDAVREAPWIAPVDGDDKAHGVNNFTRSGGYKFTPFGSYHHIRHTATGAPEHGRHPQKALRDVVALHDHTARRLANEMDADVTPAHIQTIQFLAGANDASAQPAVLQALDSWVNANHPTDPVLREVADG